MVTLTNPIDEDDEEISISGPGMGLTILPTSPSHSISISGVAPKNVYTDVLRSLTYEHLDIAPGNPSTSEPRYMEYLMLMAIESAVSIFCMCYWSLIIVLTS